MLFCMSSFFSLVGMNQILQTEWGAPSKWKCSGCFMLTSRHWGEHISTDLSYPKCVCFLWAVQHRDHICDRAAPAQPGKAWRNERLGKGKTSLQLSYLIVLWSVIFPSNKKQWDETDLVWRFVFKCSSLEGPASLEIRIPLKNYDWADVEFRECLSAGQMPFKWWEIWKRPCLHGRLLDVAC